MLHWPIHHQVTLAAHTLLIVQPTTEVSLSSSSNTMKAALDILMHNMPQLLQYVQQQFAA